MSTVVFVLMALLVIIAVMAVIAPKTYDVSRQVEIARPSSEVFDYLRSLKKMDEWSPWAKKDPKMEKKFSGVDGEVGALSYWKGNKDVGEGEQEIKKIIDGKRIESELRFLKPWKSTSDCYLQVEDAGNGKSKVKWGFSGKNKFPMSLISLFVSMDKMVGKDFEEGMRNLKSKLEGH
jgi:hypothetical protein